MSVQALARSALVAVKDQFDGCLKIKKFKYKIAATGAAIATNGLIRVVKLPKGAILHDILLAWDAGGGTNTIDVRSTYTSDGTTTTAIKSSLVGGSAGYWRMSDETAGAANCMAAMAAESWIELVFSGANGWPVSEGISGMITYFMPTFQDEIDDVTTPAGGIPYDLGV